MHSIRPLGHIDERCETRCVALPAIAIDTDGQPSQPRLIDGWITTAQPQARSSQPVATAARQLPGSPTFPLGATPGGQRAVLPGPGRTDSALRLTNSSYWSAARRSAERMHMGSMTW